MHSQRMREKPLNPWVIARPDGAIAGAHCDCMAGLGEDCTHVAALLFSVATFVQIRDSKTVTEKPAYWKLPTSMKAVEYKEVSEINFQSARSAKKELDSIINAACVSQVAQTPTPTSKGTVPEATEGEFLKFCEGLSKLDSKPVLLSTVEPYADQYIPKTVTKDYPQDLSALRDPKWFDKDYDSLVTHCQTVKVQCSAEQAKNAELETRKQSDSALWYRFRAGRITASNAKAVCTSASEPSGSLVKRICYPDLNSAKTKGIPALTYGRDNEKQARQMLFDMLQIDHENALISDSGLVISEELPFLGASPDGIWSCDCCGTACVEIKCPFKPHTQEEPISEKSCPFLTLRDGELTLKKNHQYYYQIQAQLGVTQNDLCVFFVWSEKNVHLEQIEFDEDVWDEICVKSKNFFVRGVLPELIGKYFSKLPCNKKPANDKNGQPNDQSSKILKPVSTNTLASGKSKKRGCGNKDDDEKLYCVCGQVEFGLMTACDNTECSMEWFHWGCVGIENEPQGKWYCPECRKLPAFKRKR
ncbi:uncharacterized protein LOC127846525 [Dreissena polymorpha]|uniref:uncharacterized protein LOC127846525 n=1 Tax=Dreissena polymorpha TaxID=45954 RepID=UPI0022642573|nr:uncharacterized protein LOC127846525 [Dreissena polymorpha]